MRSVFRNALPLLLLLAAACEDRMSFAPVPKGTRRDTFVQVAQMDVLWVVDNSLSMREEQEKLGRNFPRFISILDKFDIDYHVGVISTDMDRPDHRGKLLGNPKVITPSTAGSTAAFARNVNVGTGGNGNEQGFYAAARALTGDVHKGPNGGFLRINAPLAFIFVSDEDDYSPGRVEYYARVLGNVKGVGNERMIRAFAIVGHPDTQCGQMRSAGERHLNLVEAMGGMAGDICADDFGATLEDVGKAAIEAFRRFPLSGAPDPVESLKVTVDGDEVRKDASRGWSYDGEANAVVFAGDYVPPSGAIVEVAYKVKG